MNRPGTTKETGKEHPRNDASKKTTRTDEKNKGCDSQAKKDHGKRKNARRRGEPPEDPTEKNH